MSKGFPQETTEDPEYASATPVRDSVGVPMSSPDPPSILHPLSTYRIHNLPNTAYYISNFLTISESEYILQCINAQPWTTLTRRRLQPHPAPLTPSGHLLTSKTALPSFLELPVIPRLLSLVLGEGTVNDHEGLFTSSPHGRPNHVLVNEYPPGVGISPHEDGGAYFPIVCTISLVDNIVLDLEPKGDPQRQQQEGPIDSSLTARKRILQEPLSLLVTTGQIYTDYLHGIAMVTVDEGLGEHGICNWPLLSTETRDKIMKNNGILEREKTRISLTYRDVIKVKNAGKLFGGRRF